VKQHLPGSSPGALFRTLDRQDRQKRPGSIGEGTVCSNHAVASATIYVLSLLQTLFGHLNREEERSKSLILSY
jgi:hypothetical protein